MNHEQKAADKQAPKGVEDAAKEALPHLMALVRVGYSQAAIEIAYFCKDKNVSAEFMDQVISMLNSENKKKFCAELFANELAEVEQERQLPGVEEWVSVKDELPPFGERLWFRGVVSWKKETVKHFEDELTTKNEELEYGQTGWLLKDNTDFVVTDSVFPIEDLASEYVTHWRKLPEPPRV